MRACEAMQKFGSMSIHNATYTFALRDALHPRRGTPKLKPTSLAKTVRGSGKQPCVGKKGCCKPIIVTDGPTTIYTLHCPDAPGYLQVCVIWNKRHRFRNTNASARRQVIWGCGGRYSSFPNLWQGLK